MINKIIRWIAGTSSSGEVSGGSGVPPSFRAVRGRIGLVGPAGHGKTSFVWALIGTLRGLGRKWSGWECLASVEVEETLREQARFALDRACPPTTGSQAIPYDLNLRGLPRWGDRPFSLIDPSNGGASFSGETTIVSSSAAVELLLVSPAKLDEDPVDGLDLVVQRYLRALGAEQPWRRRRKLVLVLSESDRLLWPSAIHSHLLADPFSRIWPAGVLETDHWIANREPSNEGSMPELATHMTSLHQQDARLKRWLERFPSGLSALQHLEAAGVDLRVCAVSALGSQAVNGRLVIPWQPRCVLDPVFWAFEMSSA